MPTALEHTLLTLGRQARAASRVLLRVSGAAKNRALLAMAQGLLDQRDAVQAANGRDVARARAQGLAAPLLDRLTLSDQTLALMAEGLAQVAALPDPVGCTGPAQLRPNGMRVAQMRIPLGVVGVIYESRPNVTLDAAALCLKSGNAAILRGGSEALESNLALAGVIAHGLRAAGLPEHAVQVVETSERAAVGHLITMTEYVDVVVPRGGKNLIARLEAEARVPLIKHLDGNCHVYLDAAADLEVAQRVAVNAKTYRYGVCGAMETLLVHEAIAARALPPLAAAFAGHGVTLHGCPRTCELLAQEGRAGSAVVGVPAVVPATETDWATEYLGPDLAVRVVASLDEAIDHITVWGSGHTESIVTESLTAAERFQREVDASSVYVNLPTCFADGFEYGLGAEIGISTNRLHARGPVGLEGLTTYKWVLTGNGQVRG